MRCRGVGRVDLARPASWASSSRRESLEHHWTKAGAASATSTATPTARSARARGRCGSPGPTVMFHPDDVAVGARRRGPLAHHAGSWPPRAGRPERATRRAGARTAFMVSRQRTSSSASAAEHDAQVGDLVDAEEVGAAEGGEDAVEALGLAELVAEDVVGVRHARCRPARRAGAAGRSAPAPASGGARGSAGRRGCRSRSPSRGRRRPCRRRASGRARCAGRSGRAAPGSGRRRAARRRSRARWRSRRSTSPPRRRTPRRASSISSSCSRPVMLRMRAPASRQARDHGGLVGLDRDDGLRGEPLRRPAPARRSGRRRRPARPGRCSTRRRGR